MLQDLPCYRICHVTGFAMLQDLPCYRICHVTVEFLFSRGGRGSDTEFPSSPSTSSQNWTELSHWSEFVMDSLVNVTRRNSRLISSWEENAIFYFEVDNSWKTLNLNFAILFNLRKHGFLTFYGMQKKHYVHMLWFTDWTAGFHPRMFKTCNFCLKPDLIADLNYCSPTEEFLFSLQYRRHE